MEELCAGLERAYGVSVRLRVVPGDPLLVNDPKLTRLCLKEAQDLLGADAVKIEAPRMGAEDFACFLQKYPGMMIRLGCHDPQVGYRYGLHSPHFDFDERALDVGVRLFVRLIEAVRGVSSEE